MHQAAALSTPSRRSSPAAPAVLAGVLTLLATLGCSGGKDAAGPAVPTPAPGAPAAAAKGGTDGLASDQDLAKEAFQSGRDYAKNGLLDRAVSEFDRARNLDPKNYDYRLALAETFMQLGSLPAAHKTLEEALKIDPKAKENAVVLAKLGVLEVQQKKIVEGVDYLKRALTYDDSLAEVHLRLGQALAFLSDVKVGSHVRDQEKMSESLEHLQRAIELAPDDADCRFWCARVLEQKGDEDQAIARYREAIEKDPKHVDAHLRLASMLIARGELDEGKKLVDQANELSPDNRTVQFQYGLLAEQKNDLEAAKAAYQKCIDLDDTSADAYFRLANVLTRMGDDDGSKKAMEQFQYWNDLQNQYEYWLTEAKDKPDDADTLAKLGEVMFLRGEKQDALAWLKHSYELNKEQPLANRYLGLLLQDKGAAQQARGFLEKAVELGQDDPQTQHVLAACLMQLQDHEAARKVLTKLVELEPDARENYYNLGVVSLNLAQTHAGQPEAESDLQDAEARFKKALEIDGDYAAARYALASTYFEEKAWDDAVREYQAILAKDPDNADAKQFLAQAREQGGKG